MQDKFNTNEFADFDSGIGDKLDDFGQDSDVDFSDFDGFNKSSQTPENIPNTPEGKKEVIKTAIIAIVAGTVIIAGAFIVMKKIKGSKTQTPQSTQVAENVNRDVNKDVVVNKSENKNSEVDKNSTSSSENNYTSSQQANDIIDLHKETHTTLEDDEGWKEIKATDINFNDKYIDSIFTVIDIKNYTKVVNSNKDLVVKTIVRGSLSGFVGNYELELPYSKGHQLVIGNNFKVKVQIGKYKDKIVVGDIKY